MTTTTMTADDTAAPASDVARRIAEHDVRTIDFLVAGLDGAWHVASVPVETAHEREELLRDGIAIDGAILRGEGAHDEAPVRLVPDLATARTDLDRAQPSLAVVCDVAASSRAPGAHPDDVRAIAKRAERRLVETGIADRVTFSALVECAPPSAASDDVAFRADVVRRLRAWDVHVAQHRRARDARRAAFDLRDAPLVRAADDAVAFAHVVERVAPFRGAGGSVFACRQQLWRDGAPLFFDPRGYAGASQTLLHYVGGLLTHLDALLAFTAPTPGAYERPAIGPGRPYVAAFSAGNRAVAVAVGSSPFADGRGTAAVLRAVDATANPYLAYAAMLLAGLDGIRRRIDPVRAGFGPLETSEGGLPASGSRLRHAPDRLAASLDALEADHAFLLDGDVFDAAFVRAWIARGRP